MLRAFGQKSIRSTGGSTGVGIDVLTGVAEDPTVLKLFSPA